MRKSTLLFCVGIFMGFSMGAQQSLYNPVIERTAVELSHLQFTGMDDDPDLIAFFPFNENTCDSSGKAHHSTSNGVSYTADRFSHPNSAAEFSGVSNTLSLKGLAMSSPNSTLTFWILPTPDTDTILVNNFPASLKMVLRIVNNRYELEITMINKAIHLKDAVPIHFDPGNPEYDFIAIRYQDNSVIFSVNQVSADAFYFNAGEIDNLFPLTVKNNPVYFLNGIVDDVRLYSRCLSYDELNTLNRDRVIRIPELKIDSVSGAGYDYARLYTSLTDQHGSPVKEYGIRLGKYPVPDTSDRIYKFTGYFERYMLSHLSQSTEYYVQVWAKNEAGTGFSDVVKFATRPANFGSLTDIDGNVYRTIQIGTQTWMADNLKTTRYADGTPISDGDLAKSNKGKFYYQYFGDLRGYGLFYTWLAATNADSLNRAFPKGTQGVCPDGWHLPGVEDYSRLIDCLGGTEIAGQKLKVAGDEFWEIDNGTNESMFGAIAVGGIYYNEGNNSNHNLYRNAYFWSWEADDSNNTPPKKYRVASMDLSKDVTAYIGRSLSPELGVSVRCIQGTGSEPGEEVTKSLAKTGSFDVYPNPASTTIYFPTFSKPVTITIYDLQSRVRLKTNITNGKADISFYPKEYTLFTSRMALRLKRRNL